MLRINGKARKETKIGAILFAMGDYFRWVSTFDRIPQDHLKYRSVIKIITAEELRDAQ